MGGRDGGCRSVDRCVVRVSSGHQRLRPDVSPVPQDVARLPDSPNTVTVLSRLSLSATTLQSAIPVPVPCRLAASFSLQRVLLSTNPRQPPPPPSLLPATDSTQGRRPSWVCPRRVIPSPRFFAASSFSLFRRKFWYKLRVNLVLGT